MRIDVFSAPEDLPDENTGIGDALIVVPALLGLKHKYPEADIRFQIKPWQVPWARLFWPNSFTYDRNQIYEKADQTLYAGYDIWYKTDLIAKEKGMSRLGVICERFGVAPQFPSSVEVTELMVSKLPIVIKGDPSTPLVTMVPSSMSFLRSWPVQYYVVVAERLLAKGFRVAFLGKTGLTEDGDKLLETTGISMLGNLHPLQTVELLLQSKLCICNDSGITHLAGLLKKKALAICAPSLGTTVFGDFTSVSVLQATYECSKCSLLPENGYRKTCLIGCRALFDLQPETVLEKTMQLLTI